MINEKSRGVSGIAGAILFLLIGLIAILIWNHLWSEVQGTQSILDDLLLFVSQLIAGSITIGVIEIPFLGIALVITLAGIFIGMRGNKS